MQTRRSVTLHQRVFSIAFSLVIGGALGGLFLGTRQPVAAAWERPPAAAAQEAGGEVPRAVTYLEMDSRTRGPNRTFVNSLDKLVSHTPELTGTVVNVEAARIRTLAVRASRRAYEGAPPTIPHPVQDNDVRSCTACHGDGREIAGRVAPRMSHQTYKNCTQCHAPVSNPGLGPEFPVDAEFVGLQAPGRGSRAWEGAPPTIPHRTQMRENCTSCHGLLGLPGIRTTHPWRMNCLQCHAPSAEQEGYLFAVEGEIGRPALPASP